MPIHSRLKNLLPAAALAASITLAAAAEKKIDFSLYRENSFPSNFISTVSGEGKPGEWKIVLDEVTASVLPKINPNAPGTSRRPVLAQVSREKTDEHFPLLIWNDDVFGDFTLKTKVKTVDGAVEQMAGIAFRIQDEKNYYIVRVSALGNSFLFYKFVNGQRSKPIGPEIPIAKNQWHDLTIECQGHTIKCFLNGKQAIPELIDPSFTAGKIGFWTKSDSVSYFADPVIRYTPREPFAQSLIKDVLKKNPRLVDLKIYANREKNLQLIASAEETPLGAAAGQVENNVMERGLIYYGKGKDDTAIVTMPLRDSNGDTVAAVRIVMKSFNGQTENNAVARALPIIKQMEARVQTAKELFE